MLISISGLIGSGKNTVSEMLVNNHGFQQFSFAGALKDAVAVIFSWDREMLEGTTEESRAWRNEVDIWWSNRLQIPHLTPRWVLQYFGTDVCRQHFSQDIWIAALENKIWQAHNRNAKIVVSDARFRNELTMLTDIGATSVWVRRGDLPEWWQDASDAYGNPFALQRMLTMEIHRSEWDWAGYAFDITIDNEGTLDDLSTATAKLLEIGT